MVPPDRDGLRHEYDPILRHHYYSNFHMTDENMRQIPRARSRCRPVLPARYPSAVATLARFIQGAGVEPPPNIQGIIVESENVYQNERQFVERVFGRRYFACYGHSEKLVVGRRVRAIDATTMCGRLMATSSSSMRTAMPVDHPGQRGEIVGTGFINEVVPFIRYRTGDLRQCMVERVVSACGRDPAIYGRSRALGPAGNLVARDGGQSSHGRRSMSMTYLSPWSSSSSLFRPCRERPPSDSSGTQVWQLGRRGDPKGFERKLEAASISRSKWSRAFRLTASGKADLRGSANSNRAGEWTLVRLPPRRHTSGVWSAHDSARYGRRRGAEPMTTATPPTTTPDARQESHSSASSGEDRLYRNTLSSWAAYAVFVVAGFFMPRLIDLHLGQATLGVWDFGWSIVAYLSLTPLGVGSAVNRYVARYRAQGEAGSLAQTTASAFGIQLAAAAVSVGLTVALALLVQDRTVSPGGSSGSQVRWVILFLGLDAAVRIAFDVFRGVITGCHRWDVHNGLNAACYVLTVAAMASALAFGGDLPSLALATLAITLLTEVARAVVAYSICPELSVDLRRLDRGTVHQLLGFGLKSFLVDASGLFLYQSANILIATNLGVAALAVFARPMALVRHATVIVNKYAYVLAPTASSLQAVGGPDGVSALVVRTTRIAVYLAFPMMLGLAILGDSILDLWMGVSYRLGPIISVLAAGHLLPIVQEPLVSILAGTNAHGKAGLALAAAAGLAGLLGVVALGHADWGLVGAALSITIPLTLIKGLYLPFAACRYLGIPFSPYLVTALLRPALHLSPLALVLLVCRLTLPDQPLLALAWAFGLGGIVLVPVWWYGLLTEPLRARIRATLAPPRHSR